MAKYVLTNKAIQDLSEIWEYTLLNWSENQADKYYQMLLSSLKELSKNPNLGKIYFEVFPDLFGKSISKHIIFYRVIDAATIRIIRILHEEMDLKSKFI